MVKEKSKKELKEENKNLRNLLMREQEKQSLNKSEYRYQVLVKLNRIANALEENGDK